MSKFKNPFEIYNECNKLIDINPNFPTSLKRYLRIVCLKSLPAPDLEHIAVATMILIQMDIEPYPTQELLDWLKKNYVQNKISCSALEYPVFTALKKLSQKKWPDKNIGFLCVSLYLSIFNLKLLDQKKIDPNIFYHDAYYCRDVFTQHLNDFSFSNDSLSCPKKFKQSLISQIPKLLNLCINQPTKYHKLKCLLHLTSGGRTPRTRQKKKSSRRINHKREVEIEIRHPNPTEAQDGAGYQVTYPTDDNDVDAKTFTRATPPSGSKLSYLDDKHSIRGRINSQAARNVVSVTDIHRLPLPCISTFFSKLVSTNLFVLAYFWILMTTGIKPDELDKLRVGRKHRATNYQGCFLDLTNGILSYHVINRLNEHSKQLMQLGICRQVIDYISDYEEEYPFQIMKPQINKIYQSFSLSNPGQTPTPDRVSSSCPLYFTNGFFSEIETAYLSGIIPARLRAQAHYYPICISEINKKYRAANDAFIKKIQAMHSANFLIFTQKKLNEFYPIIPNGHIGSKDSLPITCLQQLLDQLHIKSMMCRDSLPGTYLDKKLQSIANFIQLQQLYLFIIEQLSFCARKFGDKTSYSVSYTLEKVWGSEKASAVASIERKCIPLAQFLRIQLEACANDLINLNEYAQKKMRYNVNCNFDLRTNPLPTIVIMDVPTRTIQLSRRDCKLVCVSAYYSPRR